MTDARELVKNCVRNNGKVVKQTILFLKEVEGSITDRIDHQLRVASAHKSFSSYYKKGSFIISLRENEAALNESSRVVYGTTEAFRKKFATIATTHLESLGFKITSVSSNFPDYVTIRAAGFSPQLSAKWRGLIRFIIVCNRYRKSFYNPDAKGKGYELARADFEYKRAKLE